MILRGNGSGDGCGYGYGDGDGYGYGYGKPLVCYISLPSDCPHHILLTHALNWRFV